MKKQHRDRIYSGWMGKMIGVIHGANIEGWKYEDILRTFGEIRDYPFRFPNFCADDDINGPAFFQRAVLDHGADPDLREMADTFLNYVSDGHGFFWWGGYGVSTEDTAYHNLLEGVAPGRSGSAQLNGKVLANQIGGQIFSDCWGLMNPGNPEKAADLACRMASLTHDEEGLQGARFIAAAIASAFEAKSVEEILETAFAQLDPESQYAAMVRDVSAFVGAHRTDWRTCFAYVKQHYDYRYYQGTCHILPNAAVIVLALLAGNGDFRDTINIAAMCGWDTDCNEGNLGTILGVFAGMEGIPREWTAQVRDLAICSGSLGGLNIQNVPQIAENTLRAAAILAHEEEEPLRNLSKEELLWKKILDHPEGLYFHFQFPESTHGIRTKNLPEYAGIVRNTEECAYIGTRSLKIAHPAFGDSQWFSVYYKPYYTPGDFKDNRYQPDLSPVIYPGDQIRFAYRFSPEDAGKRICCQAYYKNRLEEKEQTVWERDLTIQDGKWKTCAWNLPEGENIILEEVGVRIIGQEVAPREQTAPFCLYLGEVEITPRPRYRMRAKAIPTEVWTAVDTNPAGFSYLRGVAEVFEGKLGLSGSGRPAEMYTGNINWQNYAMQAVMRPVSGEEHYILARVRGGRHWYGAGFRVQKGKKFVSLMKKNGQIFVLAEIPWEWEIGKEYDCCLKAEGCRLTFLVNGEELLSFEDSARPYQSGCVGMANQGASRTQFREYSVTAL